MNYEELFAMAKMDLDRCLATLERKSHDYANDGDVLKNFKESSKIASITPVQSILVLVGTKISRLTELVTTEKISKNESVEDTILDLINYLLLLKAMIEEQREKTKSSGFISA